MMQTLITFYIIDKSRRRLRKRKQNMGCVNSKDDDDNNEEDVIGVKVKKQRLSSTSTRTTSKVNQTRNSITTNTPNSAATAMATIRQRSVKLKQKKVLNETDLAFLEKQTSLTRDQLKHWFFEFQIRNPDLELSKVYYLYLY